MIARRPLLIAVIAFLAGWLPTAVPTAFAGPPGEEVLPKSDKLAALVREVMEADHPRRMELVLDADQRFVSLDSLSERARTKLRDEMLKTAGRTGPRLKKSGMNYFYDEEKKLGKYIVEGKPGKALFIGLHGGGLGSGDAGSMASAMGGGGWWWIFPEVLKKTEHGWTDSGTEEFVLELVEAAKRSGNVDPNRIYVSGHSMGGYGSWMFASRHSDVFAGGAAYAGAPTVIRSTRNASDDLQNIDGVIEGVLPNLLNSRFFFFQSLDDKNVPPGPNMFAAKALGEWKERYPDGFDFRYVEVDKRGHAAPAEGYLPTQTWLTEHSRIARPQRLLWQPVLHWKHHYHWLYWRNPELNALIEVEALPDNVIQIIAHEGSGKIEGLSLLLGEPLVDLSKEVTVTVNGEERFRGLVSRSFSTLLMTVPRNDADLLFDARIDL